MSDRAAPAPPPAARLGAIERDPSLRRAARRIEDSEPGAIDRLSHAPERLDRRRNAATAAPPFDEAAEGAAKCDAGLDERAATVAEDEARGAARGGPDGGAPQSPARV